MKSGLSDGRPVEDGRRLVQRLVGRALEEPGRRGGDHEIAFQTLHRHHECGFMNRIFDVCLYQLNYSGTDSNPVILVQVRCSKQVVL